MTQGDDRPPPAGAYHVPAESPPRDMLQFAARNRGAFPSRGTFEPVPPYPTVPLDIFSLDFGLCRYYIHYIHTAEKGGAKMKTAIGYIRVSTVGQATEGVSLEAQRAKIEAWCAASGFALAAVHVDAGLSGGRADNRPALQAALSDVTKQRGVLIVYSLSRLARSTRDAIEIAERLERADADLVSLSERLDTTSAAGRMIFRMLAVLAEFERDQIAERTKGAMSHLRANGKRISRHVPYGWTLTADGENLAANPAEREAIALMRQLRADGLTLAKIAAALTERGIPSKLGATWTPATVRRILNREVA